MSSRVNQGSPPSADDAFYIEWAGESHKANLAFANEVLRQLVTLSSTLLGGSIVFLNDRFAPGWVQAFIALAFFTGLILAFVGMMPYEGSVRATVPEEVRRHKANALRAKRCWLWGSGLALAAGFGAAVAAMLGRVLV